MTAALWRPKTLALVTLAATVLAGCPRHVPIERAYPAPTAAALREIMRARQAEARTLNARLRATSWLGGERAKATVLALADRAGRLRLEAEVTLQGTVAVLTTNGGRFAFLDTRKNELRRGPACPANVASLVRIPLAPTDVAAILLGDARLDGASEPPDDAVSWDGDRGADVLDVARAEGGRSRILIQQPAGQRPRILGASAVDAAGNSVWRTAYEDFADVAIASSSGAPKIPLPQTIRFAEADASFDDGLEIVFKDRILDETLAPEAFSLPTPPGTTAYEVGCP